MRSLLAWTTGIALLLLGGGIWWFAQRTAQPSVQPAPAPASEDTAPPAPQAKAPIALVFVGDIMLDRDVWSRMRRFGHTYPFAKLGTLFDGADVVVGNLEGPITTLGTHAVPYGSLLFTFDPSVTEQLSAAGFDALSLANNHTHNQGAQGLADTRRSLDEAKLGRFGDPRAVTADTVWRTTVGDWRLAFVGWNAIEVADPHREELLSAIATLEADQAVDCIVVVPHWGAEYRAQTDTQITDARAFIDAGADLVIGAHPHVVQGVELYRDRLIAYSLGNFIFDQYQSAETQRGLLVRYTLVDNDDDRAQLIPISLPLAQPQPASAAIGSEILGRVADLSNAALRPGIAAGNLDVPQ